MNFELSSIMRECKYYSILSLCEVLHGNATSNMDKIEKYLLEEQNSFFLGSDFEYFSKLAKSASIVVSSEDDGNHLWISTEVLLHIITAVKKGERGRKEYLLTGKKAIELRNAIFECIVGLEESAGNHMKKYIQNSILLSFSLASQQAKKKSQLHKPQVGVPVKEEEEDMKEKPAERSHHMPKPEVSVPYLPSPSPSKDSILYQSPHEGPFSHFKVCFESTPRLQKKAMQQLLSFSKSPSTKTCNLVQAMPHLCSPRKPMREVIHEMEKMSMIESRQQCIISFSVLRQLSQRMCTNCKNLVGAVYFL